MVVVFCDSSADRFRDTEFGRNLPTNFGVRAFHLVGHRFPNVVKECSSLAHFHVCSDFGCQHSCNASRQNTLLEHITTIAGPELQAA
jgi:hypothetical protein